MLTQPQSESDTLGFQDSDAFEETPRKKDLDSVPSFQVRMSFRAIKHWFVTEPYACSITRPIRVKLPGARLKTETS